jgi:hypothetical protein
VGHLYRSQPQETSRRHADASRTQETTLANLTEARRTRRENEERHHTSEAEPNLRESELNERESELTEIERERETTLRRREPKSTKENQLPTIERITASHSQGEQNPLRMKG